MSEYRKLRTQFKSRAHLRQALKAAGVQFEECKPGQEKRLSSRYNKDGLTATFIIGKNVLDNTWGAIGWHWDGQCFVQIADHLDEDHLRTKRTLKAVKREYAVASTMSAARAKGYRVKRVDQPNGGVQLVVTGRI